MSGTNKTYLARQTIYLLWPPVNYGDDILRFCLLEFLLDNSFSVGYLFIRTITRIILWARIPQMKSFELRMNILKNPLFCQTHAQDKTKKTNYKRIISCLDTRALKTQRLMTPLIPNQKRATNARFWSKIARQHREENALNIIHERVKNTANHHDDTNYVFHSALQPSRFSNRYSAEDVEMGP